MSGSIKVFRKSFPEIKFFSRHETQGEELKMVDRYVEYVKKTNRRTKTNLAIFYEPQLEFGYPDIVIVEYNDCDKIVWNSARKVIDINDLKILSEINRRKIGNISDISETLGYTDAEIKKHFKRLKNANLIKVIGEKFQRKPYDSFNCVKKITTIEAKIDKWNTAIVQAKNSYVYASEIYILLNKKKCTTALMHKCLNYGIGIILENGSIEKALKSQINSLQRSYISLLFNEWILRIEKGGAKNSDSK